MGDFKELYDEFFTKIKEDKELYNAYRVSISGSYLSALRSKGYRLPDMIEIATNSADDFLKSCISKIGQE
jgi:hypothetical protein